MRAASRRTLALALVVCAVLAPAVGGVDVAGVGLAAGATVGTAVTDCRVIDSPGAYWLANDVASTSASDCIDIRSSGVSFDGNDHVITYTGGGYGPSGVSAGNAQNVVVSHLTLRYFGTGVRFYGVDDGEIANVTVEPEPGSDDPGASGNGIALYGGSSRNRIADSTVDVAGQWGDAGQSGNGIYVANSPDTEIVDTEVYDPAYAGVQLVNASGTTLTGTAVRANPWSISSRIVRAGVMVDDASADVTLAENAVYGLSSSRVRAMNDGIEVEGDGATLTGNLVSSVAYSGVVVRGADAVLRNNTVTSSGRDGIAVSGVPSVTVVDNVVRSNDRDGLSLDGTSLLATVENNTASANGWDVRLAGASGTTVERTALASGGPGVTLSGANAALRGVGAVTPPAELDAVGRFVEVEGSASLDVYYADAAAAGVNESALSLWRYDASGGSWSDAGGSVDAAANVVSASVGDGVYAPLANDTRAPRVESFDATSPSVGRLDVELVTDESLAALEIGVANATTTVRTLSLANVTERASGDYTYSASLSLPPGPYTLTLESAADGAGNDGASGETASASVAATLEIADASAYDEDVNFHVGDGERVRLVAVVEGYDVRTVSADASTLGVGTVALADPDGDGTYDRFVYVDAANGTPGVHSIRVDAEDAAGRTDAAYTNSLDLDVRAPYFDKVNLTTSSGGYVVGDGDTVTVTVEVTDRNGVVRVDLNATPFGAGVVELTDPDGDDVYEGSFAVDAANAGADGYYTLGLRAVDLVGNVREGGAGTRYLDASDDAEPTLSNVSALVAGGNTTVGDGDRITLSVVVTDDGGVATVSANASAFGAGVVVLSAVGNDTYEGSFVVDVANASADGVYALTITATDAAGNVATARTGALTLDTPRDTAAPVVSNVTLADPLGDGFVTAGDAVTVRADARDAEGVVATVSANASAFGAGVVTLASVGNDTYEGTFVVDAANAGADGGYSLWVAAADDAGNVGERYAGWLTLDRAIANDTSAPAVEAFTASAGPEGGIALVLNASEPLAAIDATVRRGNATVATLDAGDFRLERGAGLDAAASEGGDGPVFVDSTPRYVAWVPASDDGTYAATLTRALDRAGNDGANGQTATVTLGAPDAPTIRVDGTVRLANGTPAAGDAVGVVDTATGALLGASDLDENGTFAVSLPAGPTYAFVYAQGSAPLDGSPDLFALGRAAANATLDRTLPAAYPVTVTVVRADTGAPVADANGSVAPGDAALLGLFAVRTDAQGRYVPEGAGSPFEVAGTLHVRATPPNGSDLETNETSVDVRAPTDVVLSLAATERETDTATDDANGGTTDSSGSTRGSSGGTANAAPSTPDAPSVEVDGDGTGRVNVSVRGGRAGEVTSVDVANATGTANETAGDVVVERVDVTPLVDGDFTLDVAFSATPPEEAADAPTPPSNGTPFAYMNVGHSLADADIAGVTFRLRVSRATLAARGVAPEDVAVYRYHGGEWGAADVSVVAETADAYVLSVSVPGLSVFAVGSRASTPTDGTATSTTTTADSTTTTATTATSSTTATTSNTATTTAAAGATDAPTTGESPGFGVVAALLALCAFALLRRR